VSDHCDPVVVEGHPQELPTSFDPGYGMTDEGGSERFRRTTHRTRQADLHLREPLTLNPAMHATSDDFDLG